MLSMPFEASLQAFMTEELKHLDHHEDPLRTLIELVGYIDEEDGDLITWLKRRFPQDD
jgi:hypothetical protein